LQGGYQLFTLSSCAIAGSPIDGYANMHLAYENDLSTIHDAINYFEKCSDSVNWVTDADGYLIYVNKSPIEALCKFRGLHSSIWEKFIHPEDLQCLRASIVRSNKQRTAFLATFHLVSSYCEIRNMLILGAPRFSKKNELLGHFGTLIDVTET
jgi:hypothetical protein